MNPRFIVGNNKEMCVLLFIGFMFYYFISEMLEYIIRFPGLSMFTPSKSLHISILTLVYI